MLTRKQIRAARHVAEGYHTRRDICRILRINRATIFDWLKDDEFNAEVERHQAAYHQQVRGNGVASVRNRVRRLNTMANKIVRVMRERAADMRGVPGGTTGLLVRRYKSIRVGKGKDAEQVNFEEYEADTALMKELRDTLLQAARELGQLDQPIKDAAGDENALFTTDPDQPPVALPAGAVPDPPPAPGQRP